MKKSITKIITFDYGHKLINPKLSVDDNNKIYGKCFGGVDCVGHGHLGKLECTISGEVDGNGFIMNFVDLKNILQRCVIDKYDHKFINQVIPNVISTCENQIDYIWNDICEELIYYNKNNNTQVILEKLVFWETPTSCCTKEI